ncbi:MAG: WD40 repeat domain-containing protein [Chloroflexota bacterium]
MAASRRYLLKATAGLAAAGLTTRTALAEFDRYVLDEGRGAFAWFESRSGKKRTWTAVLISRSGGSGPDDDLFKPVVLLWTTSFNAKKGKVQRVAFGYADDGRCRVSATTDFATGSVDGTIRVWDAVKDEMQTLTLDISWTENGSERSLDFDETYSPDPDPAYSARFQVRGDQRPAKAEGEVLRGNTNLIPKTSKQGFIGYFDSARVTFTYP